VDTTKLQTKSEFLIKKSKLFFFIQYIFFGSRMRKLLFSPFSVDQVSVHLYKKNRYQRLFVFEASLTFIIIITHNYTHTIVYKLLGLIINKKNMNQFTI